MTQDNHHIDQYSADDIKKYLTGQLTADRMHAIEKAALDDPFLADAIEGFQGALSKNDEKTIDDHLADIQRLINEKGRSKSKAAPVRLLRAWPAAAAAVIIISATVWMLNNRRDNKSKPDIAYTNTQKQNESLAVVRPPASSQLQTISDSAAIPVDAAGVDKNQSNALENASRTSATKRELASGSLTSTGKKKNENLPPAPDVKSLSKSVSDDRDIAKQTAPEVSAKPAANHADSLETYDEIVRGSNIAQKDAAASTRTDTYITGKVEGAKFKDYKNFSGRVTDNNNNAIPNATITINNEKNAVRTDRVGNFNFARPDTSLDVHVASAGYESETFTLRNNTTANNLQLKPDAKNLSETAAQPRAQKAAHESGLTRSRTASKNAEPVGGWAAFFKYIDENKRSFPLSEAGEVVLSFAVNKAGEISDIKIETSAGTAQDEEAIRLIKKGPPWRITKGSSARATVYIHL